MNSGELISKDPLVMGMMVAPAYYVISEELLVDSKLLTKQFIRSITTQHHPK